MSSHRWALAGLLALSCLAGVAAAKPTAHAPDPAPRSLFAERVREQRAPMLDIALEALAAAERARATRCAALPDEDCYAAASRPDRSVAAFGISAYDAIGGPPRLWLFAIAATMLAAAAALRARRLAGAPSRLRR
jgi:hypothetical protein